MQSGVATRPSAIPPPACQRCRRGLGVGSRTLIGRVAVVLLTDFALAAKSGSGTTDRTRPQQRLSLVQSDGVDATPSSRETQGPALTDSGARTPEAQRAKR